MVTEKLMARKIRITNLEIVLYKKIARMKLDDDYKSMSAVVEFLYDFHAKNKKLVSVSA